MIILFQIRLKSNIYPLFGAYLSNESSSTPLPQARKVRIHQEIYD